VGNNSKSIAELLEERRANQGPSEMDGLIQELEELRTRVLAIDPSKLLDEQKATALELINKTKSDTDKRIAELNAANTDNIKQITDSMDSADKRVQSAIDDASNRLKVSHGAEMIEGITQLGEKIDRLATMQGSLVNLNETMSHVLGVLQSPKVIEFDADGMPIGVRTQ